MGGFVRLDRKVLDLHLARFAIEFEIDVAGAVLMDAADGVELDDQGLARLDVDTYLIPDIQTVKEDRSGQDRGVAVFLTMAVELLVNPGIKHPGEDIPIADRMAELLFQLLLFGPEIDRLEKFAGTDGEGLLVLEDNLLQLFGETAVGLTDHPLEEIDHALREGQILTALINVLGLEIVLHHEHGHVADDLRGGGYLDQVAEHVVDLAVHLLALLPAMPEAQSFDLGFVIGVLAAGDFVVVDLGGAAAQFGLERSVVSAHALPVVGQLLQPFLFDLGIPDGPLEGRHQGVEVRLGGQTRNRGK